MEWIQTLFSQTTELTVLQMSIRGIVVFIVAIIILRIAGKRTFGKQSAADNVIMIMLGAILSRAVVGTSPFLSTIIASFAIVLFHRALAWLSMHHHAIGLLTKGEPLSLFKDGKENPENIGKSLLSKKDLMEGVHLQVNSNSLDDIEEILLERNGKISVIKKKV